MRFRVVETEPPVGRFSWRVNGAVELSSGATSLSLVCMETGKLGIVVDPTPAERRRAERHPGFRWFDDTRVRLVDPAGLLPRGECDTDPRPHLGE
jgi:hypothetical protein